MELSEEERLMWNWEYKMMGDFQKALMEAICRADESNLSRLALGYPDHVSGYIKYTQERGWWEMVQRKVPAMPGINLIDRTPIKDLPTLIGTIKNEYAQKYLEEKIKNNI